MRTQMWVYLSTSRNMPLNTSRWAGQLYAVLADQVTVRDVLVNQSFDKGRTCGILLGGLLQEQQVQRRVRSVAPDSQRVAFFPHAWVLDEEFRTRHLGVGSCISWIMFIEYYSNPLVQHSATSTISLVFFSVGIRVPWVSRFYFSIGVRCGGSWLLLFILLWKLIC